MPEIIPADSEEAHARLGQLLAFDISTPSSKQTETNDNHTQQQDGKNGNDDEEEEFEFRLFSAPKPHPSTDSKAPDNTKAEGEGNEIKIQKLKIRLRSPTPVDVQPGDGRFIVPFRGWRYYFTKPELMHLSARHDHEKAQIEADELMRRREYENIAITGAEVLDWAKNTETPGCHLPWRVFRLDRKYHRVPKSLLREIETNTTKPLEVAVGEKKSKPGKKRRIILRTRAAAAAAEKAKAAETSNMTEAEKRNKKNRERKTKRRQKEREKKAALAAAASTATVTDGVGVASVDGDSSD